MQMYELTPYLSLAGSVAGEESRAVGGSIRLLGAPETTRRDVRADNTRRMNEIAGKTIAQLLRVGCPDSPCSPAHPDSRNASDRWTNSATSSVSGRRRPSIPLLPSAPLIVVFAAGPQARSALARVCRRCVNTP